MSGEFQKDIKFEEIAVGDVVVMEVFSADNTRFIGDYRGTATYKTSHHDNREGGYWNFDGMKPLYSDTSLNYRLFRVEPPSAAEVERKRLLAMEAEFYRLRGLKERVEAKLAERTQALVEIREGMLQCITKGWDEGLERLGHDEHRIQDVVLVLERLLND